MLSMALLATATQCHLPVPMRTFIFRCLRSQYDFYGNYQVHRPKTVSGHLCSLPQLLRVHPKATSAVAPSGYTRGFINQNAMADGTIVGANELSTYDVAACAALCNANSVCKAFNRAVLQNAETDGESGRRLLLQVARYVGDSGDVFPVLRRRSRGQATSQR